jgi:hypothetical protein
LEHLKVDLQTNPEGSEQHIRRNPEVTLWTEL